MVVLVPIGLVSSAKFRYDISLGDVASLAQSQPAKSSIMSKVVEKRNSSSIHVYIYICYMGIYIYMHNIHLYNLQYTFIYMYIQYMSFYVTCFKDHFHGHHVDTQS